MKRLFILIFLLFVSINDAFSALIWGGNASWQNLANKPKPENTETSWFSSTFWSLLFKKFKIFKSYSSKSWFKTW
jgi:hypothetical protein